MPKNRSVIELNNKAEDATSKIEVIKELIFGEQIKEYDSEFEKLKKEILAKKKALNELIEEVRTELSESIDNVSTDLNIRITEVEQNLEGKIDELQSEKVNKETLGQLLIDLGEKITKK
jgi:archaellum component FlaC